LGAEHPSTLITSTNLAVLLGCKGSFTEAEPLFRRALIGWLTLSSSQKMPHPNLNSAIKHYVAVLIKLGVSQEKVKININELGQKFGFRIGM
jgi:hypothetical protein